MRYTHLKILVYLFLVASTSCTKEEERIYNKNSTKTPCAIVSSSIKDKAFALSCDTQNSKVNTSKLKPVNIGYDPTYEQLCKVNFNAGIMTTIVCQNKVQTLQDHIIYKTNFNRLYACTGLNDSTTGAGNHDEVIAHFKEDGKYMLYYKAYGFKTDSAWLVDDMAIHGTYFLIPPNKITIVPSSLTNGLTKDTSFTIEDAPSYIKDPKTIEIIHFGGHAFNALTTRFDDKNNMYEKNLTCKQRDL